MVHASEELQRNRAVVLAACKCDGRILEELGPALRNDREVVLTAVRSSAAAIRFASVALRTEKGFMKAAIEANEIVRKFITKEFAEELQSEARGPGKF